jgi:hypothetical protein
MKIYIANANHSGQTGVIFISMLAGHFTKLCRGVQKLADRSSVSEKPNFSPALHRVFLVVLMGNSDSTQDSDVGDTVYTSDRLLGSEFSSATGIHVR